MPQNLCQIIAGILGIDGIVFLTHGKQLSQTGRIIGITDGYHNPTTIFSTASGSNMSVKLFSFRAVKKGKRTLMITRLLACCFGFLAISAANAQTLPPVAQALYDEAWAHDSAQVNFALAQGATIVATPDSNSFYVQWFPTDSTAATSPLIVTLHGSNGYAFNEFYDWFSYAQARGCGIIALQWYRGTASVTPNDYFTDTVLYRDIDTALTRIGYPSGRAFLHGFSRGAARSYAIAFLDKQWGKNYFCTILSNSGGAMSGYPIYAAINAGTYGTNVFAGKQWALFCGGLDPDPAVSGCTAMTNTNTWLTGQGASVGIFIQDATLGHGGFSTVPAYIDSVLDYYSGCYTSHLSVTKPASIAARVYPNPCEDVFYISAGNFGAQSTYTITNALGSVLQEGHPGYAGNTAVVDVHWLPAGTYLLTLTSGGDNSRSIIVKQ